MPVAIGNDAVSAGQYRAARAMLGLSIIEASRRAGVSASAILRAETAAEARPAGGGAALIRSAYEADGIVFIGLDGLETGVMLRWPEPVQSATSP